MSLNIVKRIDGDVKIGHVLASVSDKSGLDVLIPGLVAANPDVKIYSTGGTYVAIEKILGTSSKNNLVAVSEYTGQPEMQGGLVKTLDFKIYLGLLSETYNESHQEDLVRVGGVQIDMVVVNLYPFQSTVAQDGVTPEMARTNIDIGGPCMIRASAKNYLRVASVTDPADYAGILEEIQGGAATLSLSTRLELMKKAFAHTADYDSAIAEFFAKQAVGDVEECYG